MRKSIIATTVAGIFAFPALALANPINSGFETGDLTGWTSNGHSTVVSSFSAGSHGTVLPTEGKYFSVTTGHSPSEASYLVSSPFTVETGDKFSFGWFFLAGDYMPYNDYGGFVVTMLVNNTPILSDILSTVKAVDDFGFSGWQTEELTMKVGGNVSFSVYVAEATDSLFNSHFGLDNFQIIKDGEVQVPIVGTLPLVALGALSLFGFAARRKGEGFGDGSIVA